MQVKQNLNFSKYKRFFAFGCSFTNYKWPSWPEVIAQYIPESYNLGIAASDNRLIYLRVLDADCVYNFNKDDLVIVMFTNHWRDTYFHQSKSFELVKVKDEDLVFNEVNFVFRDYCFFKAVWHLLEHKNVDYDLLSMSGYTIDLYKKHHSFAPDVLEKAAQIENMQYYFSNPLSLFKPSMFELCYDCNWANPSIKFARQGSFLDNHPTPSMALTYMKTIYKENSFDLCQDYINHYDSLVVGNEVHARLHPQYEFKSILKHHPLYY